MANIIPTNTTNITSFIDNKTIVISDPEGLDIEKFLEYSKGSTKTIVCGDILDSTKISMTVDTFINTKCNNIKNIDYVVKHPDKVKLLFGNRDLNKFKCKKLCHIKLEKYHANAQAKELVSPNILSTVGGALVDNHDISLEKQLEKQFNDCTLDPTIDTFLLFDKMNVSWSCKMKNWYTFWSPFLGDTGKKDWSKESDYSKLSFYRRFYDIFGADNINGTMSAQNLLLAIPVELKIINKEIAEILYNVINEPLTDNNKKEDIFNKIKNNFIQNKDFEKLSGKTIIQSIDNLLNYMAFVTIYVFKSMTNPTSKTHHYSGLLHKLYVADNTYFIAYSTQNEHAHIEDKGEKEYLYIYSHGGLSARLAADTSILKTMYDLCDPNKSELAKKFRDFNYNFTNNFTNNNQQTGGYHKTNVSVVKLPNILKVKIEKINNFMKNILVKACNEDMTKHKNLSHDVLPSQEELFLLATSAPLNIKTFLTKCNTFLPEPTYEKLFVEGSPINPGILDMRQYAFVCDRVTAVQILGHVPKGYSGACDMFSNKDNVSYVYNLDISNTIMSTSINKGSYTLLRANPDKSYNVYSKINIKVLKDNIKNIIDLNLSDIGSHFTNNNENIFLNDENTSEELVFEKKNGNIFDDVRNTLGDEFAKNNTLYHGIFIRNGEQVKLFTIFNGGSFQKFLVEINDKTKPEIRNKFFCNVEQTGGSNYISFNKYIKYMKKNN